jgi:hypothetical protein
MAAKKSMLRELWENFVSLLGLAILTAPFWLLLMASGAFYPG